MVVPRSLIHDPTSGGSTTGVRLSGSHHRRLTALPVAEPNRPGDRGPARAARHCPPGSARRQPGYRAPVDQVRPNAAAADEPPVASIRTDPETIRSFAVCPAD